MPVLHDGHNKSPLVEIGLNDLPKFGGAMASPAPPGTTGLMTKEVLAIWAGGMPENPGGQK